MVSTCSCPGGSVVHEIGGRNHPTQRMRSRFLAFTLDPSAAECNTLQLVSLPCNLGRVSFWAQRLRPSVATVTMRCDQNHPLKLVLAKTSSGSLLPVSGVLVSNAPAPVHVLFLYRACARTSASAAPNRKLMEHSTRLRTWNQNGKRSRRSCDCRERLLPRVAT